MRANSILLGPPLHRVIVIGLSAHLLCAVLMVSTNAEAQSSFYDNEITGRFYTVRADANRIIEDANKLIRAGKAVNFNGAGSTCDFTAGGDQLGRGSDRDMGSAL